MRILEFGDKTKRKLLLIHGFQMPVELWQPYIEYFEKEYHVFVPILPGHDPDQKEEFTSFEECAAAVEERILQYGEEVHAIFAASMGGVFAATLWQRGVLQIDKLILDGAPLVGLNGWMKRFMTKFYLDVTHKSQAREPKTVKRAVGNIIPQAYLEPFLKVLDTLSDESIENYLKGIGNFALNADMGASNTEIYFFHGTKMNEYLAKRSARSLKKYYPSASVTVHKGKGHCEDAIFYPDMMIKKLDMIL